MLVKLLNLKVMRLKQAKILLTDGGGQVCAPRHTSVCKLSRLSNLAILLILGRSFQW